MQAYIEFKDVSDKIEALMRKLTFWAIVKKDQTKADIEQCHANLLKNLNELAEGLSKRFPMASTGPYVYKNNEYPTGQPKPFKITKGTVKRNLADNNKDYLTGCINRMFVTNDQEEFIKMTNAARCYAYQNEQLALEQIGAITIPEYVPERFLEI